MSAAERLSVLVVDDDKSVCDIISGELGGQGYSTVVAGNGREALDYLKVCPSRPGLILLDLMMPVMTGWEFRKVQQSDPELAAIPVAIITGMPGMEKKAETIGAVDVLCKPSRVEELTALVSRFCK
ncbi:MAG TPA: response regulator [Elusimicrobia bacterium]|nr:MAG: hypothetical protein A2X29_11510 [Elusimicrobia bacterium GWA2_64_40]OGR64044.1 MAG: hypothetical protein A2X30_12245 [Elusimicrobia bacterium GWB2_63_16]HAN05851.1 response regulator [Elusimicrobiota bacterium]HAU88990.1 response regulator [Elusimicrobiota bacterium]